jgi:peptidyl-dipeptidase Dcp
MKTRFSRASTGALLTCITSLGACASLTSSESEIMKDNVLLAAWTGPYGGVPAFDRARLAELQPALETGMAAHLVELEVIAGNPAPATFENTILAMEGSGRDLGRVFTYWGIWSSNLSTPEFREIQAEMVPKLAEYRSAITQNAQLFERIQTVYEGEEMASLRPDQKRLVWLVYNGFARNGATLEGAKKERYAAINQRLAELYTQFANHVLADEEGYVHYLQKEQLNGLSGSLVQAAASAAAERGHEGEYAILNTRSSMDPFWGPYQPIDLPNGFFGTSREKPRPALHPSP